MAARATADARAAWQMQLDLGQLWAARDYARVGVHLEQALALARALDDPAALAGSLNRLGNWLVNTGQAVAGVARHREALVILEGLDDRQGMAETLDLLGMAEWIGNGEMVEAVRDFSRAIDLWRALDQPRHLSSCLVSRAVAASPDVFEPVGSARWHPEACRRDLVEGLQLAEAADWAAGRAYACYQAGLVYAAFGQFAAALDYLQRGLDLAITIDHRQWIAAAHSCLGEAYVFLLDPGAAREHLQIGLAMALDVGSSWWAAAATTYLVFAHLQEGDAAAAEAALAALLTPEAAVALTPGTLQERRLAWAWSEVWLVQGRPAEALDLADALLHSAPGTGPIPALLTVRGEALLALGRADEAVRALGDALRGAIARHERPRLWRIHLALGAAHRALGNVDPATRAVEMARATIDELATSLPAGVLRDGFRRAAEAQFPEQVPDLPAASVSSNLPFGLTVREVEVLRLVAEGLPNTQIAERLFVSRHTVNGHLKAIFGKLGVNTRAAAARLALERGLA